MKLTIFILGFSLSLFSMKQFFFENPNRELELKRKGLIAAWNEQKRNLRELLPGALPEENPPIPAPVLATGEECLFRFDIYDEEIFSIPDLPLAEVEDSLEVSAKQRGKKRIRENKKHPSIEIPSDYVFPRRAEDRLYYCNWPNCLSIYSDFSTCRRHIKSNHFYMKFNCKHCSKSYTTYPGLWQHLKKCKFIKDAVMPKKLKRYAIKTSVLQSKGKINLK